MQPTSPVRAATRPGRGRPGRTLAALAALVLLAHALLLRGLDAVGIGAAHEPGSASMSVRTIEAAPALAAGEPAVPTVDGEAAPAVALAPPKRARPPRAAREPSKAARTEPSASPAADAMPVPLTAEAVQPAAMAASQAVAADAAVPAVEGMAEAAVATTATTAATIALPSVAAAPVEAAPALPPAASQPLLPAGERPPVYRTRLPPPATLRYQVRSGFLRGTGEIRWRREGEGYGIVLEARIAGLTLLKWSSDGRIDEAGLAPTRFLDQRARRAPQAANFQRESGKVTFSGPPAEWPLYAGMQDELSWMIQLAGIAAAEPALLVDSGRITLVVVGARGEARVWNVRYAGRENVETASGTIHAVKFVRDRDGPYDRSYEIWLDPANGYLPAHVTRRNADGSSDFDILLDRIEPTS